MTLLYLQGEPAAAMTGNDLIFQLFALLLGLSIPELRGVVPLLHKLLPFAQKIRHDNSRTLQGC